jgi:hypothetical protein
MPAQEAHATLDVKTPPAVMQSRAALARLSPELSLRRQQWLPLRETSSKRQL